MSNAKYADADVVRAAKLLNLPVDLGFSAADVLNSWKQLSQHIRSNAGESSFLAEEVDRAKELLIGWMNSRSSSDLNADASRLQQSINSAIFRAAQNRAYFLAAIGILAAAFLSYKLIGLAPKIDSSSLIVPLGFDKGTVALGFMVIGAVLIPYAAKAFMIVLSWIPYFGTFYKRFGVSDENELWVYLLSNGQSKKEIISPRLDFTEHRIFYHIPTAFLFYATLASVYVSMHVHKALDRPRTTASDWQILEEREGADTGHYLAKDIVRNSGEDSSVRLAIGCNTSGTASASALVMLISAGDRVKIVNVATRREGSASPMTITTLSDTGRGLVAMKPIEALSKEEWVSQFGPSGLVMLGKWMLVGGTKEQVAQDIADAVSAYYDQVFSLRPMHVDLTYKLEGKEFIVNKTIEFDKIAPLRGKIIESCFLWNPYSGS
jgi:hypothetical protein